MPNGTENDCTDFPQKLFVANLATRVGGLCGVHGRTTGRAILRRLLTLPAPPRASGFIDRRRKNPALPAAALPRGKPVLLCRLCVLIACFREERSVCCFDAEFLIIHMYAQRFDYFYSLKV